ncbi:hypothetical protein WJX73_004379 [Symbiochloris irregularis]|uniref:Uncharacterized protein n=1 Tax=Symbiochloris irregularis TaxID=706552 RepID=A0AAW1NWT3_9CHLO
MATNESSKKDSEPTLVQKAWEGETAEADRDELTTNDFSAAATQLQETAAGALQYVKESLLPAGGEQPANSRAETDPEVKEFREAAAEAVDSMKKSVEPKETAQQEPSLYDKAAGAAETAKEKALPTAKATGPKEGDSTQSFSAAAGEVKDSVANAASSVADRFTANPSGANKGKTSDVEHSKQGGLLSGILPKSNKGESRDGKSLGDKASEQYDRTKGSAQETEDKIAEQITPTTQEQADVSAGYIPSGTAQQK